MLVVLSNPKQSVPVKKDEVDHEQARREAGLNHEGTTMKLKVVQVGNPAYPRYSLVCENDQWFDGTNWTPFKKKAALYASLPVARSDWKRLSQEMESGMIELVGTLVVRLCGIKDLTAEQITELAVYLSAASTFVLDYRKPRPNWLGNAVVSCQLIWDLKPRK